MRESLRVRLMLWYGLTLLAVVVLHGAAVSYQSWRALLATLDTELRSQGTAVAAALRPVDAQLFDLELTPATLDYFRQEEGPPYYAIWNRAGAIGDQYDPARVLSPAAAPAVRSASGSREVVVAGPAGSTVLVGRPMAAISRAQRTLLVNVALAGAGMLGVSLVAGWFLAGRALAPMARISRAARLMADGDLSARIPIDRTESELEQLALVLNEAFDRQRRAVEQQRRFTADASHELRTPIAVLRTEAEWALDKPRSTEEYCQSLAVCQRAASRLQQGVEQMLTLARAESVEPAADAAPVALGPLVGDVVAWLSPLAQERAVEITVTGDAPDVCGNAAQLRQALANVIANAIVYNKRGGHVTVETRSNGARTSIAVSDTGIGIPPSAMPHVFDRFYRVDPTRSRETGGTGLGLSIAAAIVGAHGGTITCTSEEGAGSTFVMTLDRA
jgi:heavy metal sensor kinase